MLICLLSCSKTPEEQLIVDLREHIKTDLISQFKDPSSYQEVSLAPLDTVSKRDAIAEDQQLDYYIEQLATRKIRLATYGGKETRPKSYYEQDVKDSERTVDNILAQIKETPIDKIGYVVIEHKYRAKNGFGARDLGRFEFHYYPDKTNNKEKFFLFSKE